MLGLSSKLSKPIENAKVVRNGLKLWHKYRDDATDSSQEANHGTAFTGRGLEFDGVADHLTGLPSPTSEMTISLWVYPLSSAAGGLITWDESGGNHDYDFVLYRSGGKIVAKWDTDTLETTVTGNYSLLENTWYRVTVTQSSDTFKIYINGQLDISSSITAHLSGSRVGAVGRMYANTYNSENFFSGIMSDVQVWDTAWTQDDVTFDFNNPDKLPIDICNNSATLEIADCVKHLQINEGNGTSLYDGMGGDSGVITGCEWKFAVQGKPSGKELVVNGDAEVALPTLNGVASSTYQATVTRSNDRSYSGDYSVKIVISGVNGSYRFDDSAMTGISNSIVSFYVYIDSDTATDLTVWVGNNEYNELLLATNEWHYIEVEANTEATSRYLDVRIKNGEAGDIFYIDNLSVKNTEQGIDQTGFKGYNKPMVFSGSEGVDCGDIDNLQLEASDTIVISVWGKANEDWLNFCGRRASGGNVAGWETAIYNNKLCIYIDNGSNNSGFVYGDSVVNDNILHHFIFVITPSSVVYYVDGQTDGVGTWSDLGDCSSVYNFRIGHVMGFGYYKDYLNEMATFKNPNTFGDTEALEMFNGGTPLDATTHSQADSLVGYWRNDGDTTWTDRSGNGNDGTVNGSPETVLLTEGNIANKDTLGFPILHPNTGELTLHGEENVNSGDVGTIKGLGFWVKPSSTTIDMVNCDGGTHTITSSSGTISAGGFASPEISVNGLDSQTLTIDIWQYVSVSTNTGFSADDLEQYKSEMDFDEFVVYDDFKTRTEWLRNYRAGQPTHRND